MELRGLRACVSSYRAETIQVVSGFPKSRQLSAYAAAGRVILIGTGLALHGGCASHHRAPQQLPYLIAVRYDVEPLFVGLGRPAGWTTIRRDFQAIARLGFDSVLLDHVEDADRMTLLDIAHDAGLIAPAPDRSVEHFVATGALPPGAVTPRELPRALPKELVGHPAFCGLQVHFGPDPAAADRAGAVVSALSGHGIGWVRRGDGRRVGGTRELIRIDPAVPESDAETSHTQWWLRQFHMGLIRGRTGGIVVDRFRRPADRPGLAGADTPFTPAQAAAMNEVITRARRWGPRIRGFHAEQVTDAATDGVALEVSAFTRARRRYLMIFNPAADGFARTSVILPKTIGGATAGRAVAVPAGTDQMAGRVVDARRGRITLRVALRPGDAALFEIF